MQSKLKFKSHGFILILSTIFFAAFNCEQKKTVEASRNEEIVWQQTALDSLRVFSLAAHQTVGVIAGSCAAPIYRSLDRGNSWSPLLPACPGSIAINMNGEIFLANGAAIRRSIDNGMSWTSLASGFFRVNLKAIAFNHRGEIFTSSLTSDETRGGIYYSINNGDTWVRANFPDSIGPRVLAINSKGDIFAGTGFGVFRSTDNGQTWVQINTGFRLLGFKPFISALAIGFTDGEIFTAVDGDGVYHSTDNGDTWVLTGLTNPSISSIVMNSVGHIFAGSGSVLLHADIAGIFYSKDKGKSWKQINDGLTNLDVLSIAIDSSDYLYAGTLGSGVFRTVNATTQ